MITPRPAATLILCRDRSPDTASGSGGIEVLLVQRTHRAVFMPGVYVFPGGAVDTADSADALHPHINGLSPADADALLEVEQGGLGYMTAALRECFEEAGLLLAQARGQDREHASQPGFDSPYIHHQHPEWASCTALRQQMLQGQLTLAELCESVGVCFPLDRMAYLSRWITPEGPPRRFDTRFFLAKAPAGQTASHDGQETIGHLWISPREAVARNRRGELPLGVPTLASLQTLTEFDMVDDLITHFQRPGPAPRQPRSGTGRAGRRIIAPGDPAYAEIEKLDPHGEGKASYEIQPGEVIALSPTVYRVTAPNPGPMTGPGTNTYILGQGRDRAVIDPGPAIESHLNAILAAVGSQGGQLRWILVTHTHRDHSPAAARLKDATGATVLGLAAPDDGHQDHSFSPDRALAHGECIQAEDFSLRALHTPGHASNHICYLHEQERLLFSGDHIMQGSTVVINPPDGDMIAYLESLAALKREKPSYIAPGHGFLMDQPDRVIDRLVAHRQKREDKLVTAMQAKGPALEQTLLPIVYDDVPAAVHPLAHRSMLAHLYKLRDEGRAGQEGDCWVWIA
jgi:glyoxylase-like metal-dependent hydrolase (beta-lactamase superfamily II)/8-oxo-dGTP pyrophosphatase MutT (NUDIX family)